VLNHIYSRRTPSGGIEYFSPLEVENVTDAKGAIVGAKLLADGSAVEYGGIGTMSKSKNNGIDPQSLIDTMGADTARLFVMFASPPEQTLEWSDTGVEGAHRYLRRVWAFCHAQGAAITAGLTAEADWRDADAQTQLLRRNIHTLLRQADYDYQRMQYNTVVSACMKMLNTLESAMLPDTAVAQRALAESTGVLLRVLYPVAPHLTWTLWNTLGFAAPFGDLLDAPWPQVEDAALASNTLELVLQVNGKLRGSLTVSSSADRPQIEAAARAHEMTVRFLEGRSPKRVVVVPGKLVNVVG